MSVATKNPFSVLDEEASSRPVSPPPASAAPPQPPTAPSTRGTQRSKTGPASRGGGYYRRGGGPKSADPDRQPPATAEEPPAGSEGTKRRFDGERRDGRGRGRGGPRGRGRTFDKHSATGRTDSDKKVHQSWGGDDGNAERQVEEAALNDAVESANINDWAAPADGAAGGDDWASPADGAAGGNDGWGAPPADEPTTPAPANGNVGAGKTDDRRRDRDREEEEDNTLTLEQYLAKQEKDNANIPRLEVRKANEGADDALWQNTTLLEKGEEEAYFTGKTKGHKFRTEKKKEDKVFLEIAARFDRPSRGRGRGADRGDRGRDRGGYGGRDRVRDDSHVAVVNVNVDDENAFPALS